MAAILESHDVTGTDRIETLSDWFHEERESGTTLTKVGTVAFAVQV